MKIIDLHPIFSKVANDLAEFQMDCPVCSCRLGFKAVWQGSPRDGYHGMSARADPMIDWNTMTITPSLRYSPGTAHGPKSTCVPHFTITNGTVLIA